MLADWALIVIILKWKAAVMLNHLIHRNPGDFALVKPTTCGDLEALPERLH